MVMLVLEGKYYLHDTLVLIMMEEEQVWEVPLFIGFEDDIGIQWLLEDDACI